jgi:hypothetical protein
MTRLARGMTHIATLGILAIVLILVLTVVVWLKPTPRPIPAREQTSLDSLMATAPAFQAQRETLVVRETTYVTRSTERARQAAIAELIADSLRTIAETLQRAAEAQGDTAAAWRRIADVRRVETDSLRAANRSLDEALADQTVARGSADARATAAEQRLAATDDLAQRLANDIKRGDCRVLVVFNCPSRRATLAIGLVGGAALYAVGEKVVRKN